MADILLLIEVFFQKRYVCPLCGTKLNIEMYVVGWFAVCSFCNYEYLNVEDYGLETFLRMKKELEKKMKKYEKKMKKPKRKKTALSGLGIL